MVHVSHSILSPWHWPQLICIFNNAPTSFHCNSSVNPHKIFCHPRTIYICTDQHASPMYWAPFEFFLAGRRSSDCPNLLLLCLLSRDDAHWYLQPSTWKVSDHKSATKKEHFSLSYHFRDIWKCIATFPT